MVISLSHLSEFLNTFVTPLVQQRGSIGSMYEVVFKHRSQLDNGDRDPEMSMASRSQLNGDESNLVHQ